jgi:hypothetical protein
MMIVTISEFQPVLTEFVNWKRGRGFDVEVHVIDDDSDPGEIQAVLQEKYDSSGLTHIILVGDIEHVPSHRFHSAPSDPSYALLEGDDYIGDALISRISVKNIRELRNQLNKFIFYERGRFNRTGWIQNAVVVGTHEFNGVDHTTGIATVMQDFPSFFSSVVTVLEIDADPHGALMSAIQDHGANMIVINSHGGPDGFYSIRWWNVDIPELTDFCGSFPFIHGAACSTGSFQWSDGDCFGEMVLKVGSPERPAGPVGMLGFSCSTDPGPAMMAQRKAFKELYFNEQVTTLGELTYFSILYAQGQFPDYEAERAYKHWHLFGDCSLSLWKHPPGNS